MKTCIILLILLSLISAQGDLKGNWVSQGEGGSVSLQFVSESQLIYDGEPSYYTLVPNAIRIQDSYGFAVDYPYILQNGALMIYFPEGYSLIFSRAKAALKRESGRTSTPATGNVALLRGWLCSWSGSSSSYSGSSYSSSTRVYFDGNGRFSVNSESSFSSDAGLAYGGGPDDQGSYSVSGGQVILTFGDGSRGIAQVKMQQSNGLITEIMYEGTLYATGLCE